MVWSRAASSMPSTIARKTKFRRCGLTSAPLVSGSEVVCALVIRSCYTRSVAGLTRRRRTRNTLSRVQLFTELVHQLQLGLQVVNVVFLVGDDAFQQEGAGRVLLLAAHDDTGLEPVQHVVFDRQVGLELLAQRLTDAQREQPLVVRQPVQQQDAVGDRLGVPHLIERFSAGVACQLGEAPVLLHLGVQKVLIDRGELAGQLFVEKAQNIRITLHDRSLLFAGTVGPEASDGGLGWNAPHAQVKSSPAHDGRRVDSRGVGASWSASAATPKILVRKGAKLG